MKDHRKLAWIVLILMLVLDQATKEWARHAFREHQQPGFPWRGVLEFTLTYNRGIAFGLWQGAGVLMAPVAIFIAIIALNYSRRNAQEGAWVHTAMGLLAAGALGNLYDRVINGRVTDMIFVSLINFPVFNVADACITVAAVILLLTWSRDFFKHPEVELPSETVESPFP